MLADYTFTEIFLSHFIDSLNSYDISDNLSETAYLSVDNNEISVKGRNEIIDFFESGRCFKTDMPLTACTKSKTEVSNKSDYISICFRQDKMYYVSCFINKELNHVLSIHICTFIDMSKKYSSILDISDMNYILNNMFYALYSVNLYDYTFEAIQVPKRHINYINKLNNNYLEVFQVIIKDFVHHDDYTKMLQYVNPQVILNFFKSGKKHLAGSFRRNIQESTVWVTAHIMPLQDFNSENPRAFIGFEATDSKRIDEFEQSFNNVAISNMYTLIISVDTNLEYYNCIHYTENILKLENFGTFESFKDQLLSYVYEEDKMQLHMLIASLKNIDKNDRIESEFRLFDRNGVIHYYVYCITRNLSIDGDKFVLFVQNIDYQKHIELEKERLDSERLRSQNVINALSETYSTILAANVSTDLYYIVRSEYDFESIYKNCDKFTDAIKSYTYNFIHPDDRNYIIKFSNLTKILNDLPPDKKSIEFEFRHIKENSNIYEWVRGEIWFITRTETGCAKDIIFTVKNIDNEKKEESEARYMNAVFGSSIVESFDYIYEIDCNSKIVNKISYEQNKIIHTQLGTGNEFMLQTVNNIFPDHRNTFLSYMSIDALTENLNIETPQQYFEIKRKTDSGYKWFSYTCRYMDIHNKHFILILLKNINSLREQEEKSKQLLSAALKEAQIANEAKSDFLSNMSHDIRTPMNAIVGMTTIATAYIDDKERIKDCLSKITISSKHLLNLINDILDMSKIENGKIALNADEFNFADLIHNFITIVKPEAEKKSLKFEVHTNNIVNEHLIGDILRLQQIFINITGNAVKFTGTGGKITIRITETGSSEEGYTSYQFKFTDTGIGMSESFISRIFQPFERAQTSTISRTEGTGLGMAITKSIIDMMNGNISVESTKGLGTTFTVTIPFKCQENKITVPEKIYGKNILLFSEDTGIVNNSEKMFTDYGLKHSFVFSSPEAYEKINSEKFDMLIIDWNKNDMEDRQNLVKKINEMDNPIPIIPLSYLDKFTIENAIGKTTAAFIQRPLFRTTLISALSDAADGVVSTPVPPAKNVISHIPDYSGKRILLVEDNNFNVEIAKELLGMSNIEIDYANDGSVAVEKMFEAEENYYDLILMDIQMPEMDGYEATEIIRYMDREDVKTLPIIALTANAFSEDIKKAKEAGMNNHISKPIDLKNLYKVLSDFL